ncbi:MAG: hypothetical protein ABEJ61_02945 [Haloferacaceae archaeon]
MWPRPIGPDVTDERGGGADVPDRPPGGGLVATLRVPRNAAVGAAAGVALAAATYLVRVLELLGPFRGTRQYPVLGPEGWFLLLAVVLATTTALLVTTLLTLVTAYRLARTAEP